MVWHCAPELPPVPLELPPELPPSVELPELEPPLVPPEEVALPPPEVDREIEPLALPELVARPVVDPLEPFPLALEAEELPEAGDSSTSGRTSDRPQAHAATQAVAARPQPRLAAARIAQKPLSLMQMPRSGSFTMYEQYWLFGQGPPCWGSQIALQVPPKLTAPP